MDFLRVQQGLGTGTMRVVINGKAEEVPGGTVLEILKAKGVEPHMVAVELNTKILDREELSGTAVKEGDALELLFYMGGGR
jgi:sulfur carrier protein